MQREPTGCDRLAHYLGLDSERLYRRGLHAEEAGRSTSKEIYQLASHWLLGLPLNLVCDFWENAGAWCAMRLI